MPKYFCDYCDTYLTHDSPSVRKTHCAGRKHKENVKAYYQKWMEEQAQTLIDTTTAAFKAGTLIQPSPVLPPHPAHQSIHLVPSSSLLQPHLHLAHPQHQHPLHQLHQQHQLQPQLQPHPQLQQHPQLPQHHQLLPQHHQLLQQQNHLPGFFSPMFQSPFRPPPLQFMIFPQQI
ncbi:U1 small nuclear ribonucleoprotein C [Eurytemora carolleeae]|uniref:U1 small nuclear ribonucleoprotein C n=1 Tax=Eurytemora carolleeae TaxID=1294199 RepID=UPI000C792A46|nr:U1 small nuclear ribonucleoprotein C [Eurytemora carolleeae]|eukprot:XP_023320877.1 U1 small nuclear ribonucleoprotein C-like [Eurytemora affinis]